VLAATVAGSRAALEALAPGALEGWAFFLREPFPQQLTGFVLLGLVLLTLALPLRKRVGDRLPGHTNLWRLLHAVVGALLVGATALHTGLRLGQRVNLVLSAAVLVLVVSGGLGATGWRRTPPQTRWSRALRFAHVAFLWPALGLIAAHLVAVYYY
jgi:hypothetical protein